MTTTGDWRGRAAISLARTFASNSSQTAKWMRSGPEARPRTRYRGPLHVAIDPSSAHPTHRPDSGSVASLQRERRVLVGGTGRAHRDRQEGSSLALTQLRPAAHGQVLLGVRRAPLGAAPDQTRVAPQSYTPRHLSERILTSRPSLGGERKQVTVLFIAAFRLLCSMGLSTASSRDIL